MMTKGEIAVILKNLRKMSGLTQQQLADLMGRSQQVIGHWETGYSQPDISTLLELFELYDKSIDETFLNRQPVTLDNDYSRFKEEVTKQLRLMHLEIERLKQ